MSTFNYNQDIPNGPNNPSADQPLMKTNTNSIYSILDVDHYTFESSNQDGYHKVIHQPPQIADPVAMLGYGQTYVKTISGDQQLFYESGNGIVSQLTNSGGVLPRAAVNFTVAATVVTVQSSFNVNSVTRLGAGLFTINFTTALSSQYYYPCIAAQGETGSNMVSNVVTFNTYIPTTTSITINTSIVNSSVDPIFASVIVFL